MEEINKKKNELRSAENELEQNHADLKSLKIAYNKLAAEIDRVTADNERFVADVSSKAYQMSNEFMFSLMSANTRSRIWRRSSAMPRHARRNGNDGQSRRKLS